MTYLPLAELTEAHPEWRKADTMPSDLMTVDMVAVYTQRNQSSVLKAMRNKELFARQASAGGTWYTLLPDVQRWFMGLPLRRRPLRSEPVSA